MNSKRTVICLVVSLVLLSQLMVLANAQSATKSFVPQFTVKYVDNSYDVAPTYGIDEYTGQNVTKSQGYHVDNQTIVFTIKNPQFTPYTDSSGEYIGLYYNFRAKGHYGDNWRLYPFSNEPSSLYPSTNAQSIRRYSGDYSPEFPASNSEYTEIAIFPRYFDLYGPAIGRECDFQVQAMIGHIDLITTGPIAGDGYYSYTGQFSAWSSTETIYLITTQPTTQPSPAVPEFSYLIIIGLFILAPLTLLIKKRIRLKAGIIK